MTNKEIYDHYTAELFSELYVNHPVAIDFQLSSENRDVKIAALRFLEDNGYIKFVATMAEGFHDVRFTDRGLGLLEMPSESDSATIGLSLVEAVKNQGDQTSAPSSLKLRIS